MIAPGRERALCPITMTRACVGALAVEPALLAKLIGKITSRTYDPTFRPWWEKDGITLGMGMTEKQGGTDVLAKFDQRHAVRRRATRITGHKWSCRRRCVTRSWCWRRRRAGSPVS
jgi:putative acyl-CoA dehydrogenase